MDQPYYIITASALRTPTALYIASGTLLAVGLIAELLVKVFGNWLLLFRRFSHRLSVWLGILCVVVYMSFFFLAQADRSLRPLFFYWEHDYGVTKTGADWVLPSLVFSCGVGTCVFYLIAILEWFFSSLDRDRGEDVYEHWRAFFIIERLASATLLLLFLPGFFLLLRSIWSPLHFGQNLLFSYLFLLEKTLDALTFGVFDSFNIHIVNPGSDSHELGSMELWLYLVFVGVIVIPTVISLGKAFFGRREVAAIDTVAPKSPENHSPESQIDA